MNPIVEGHGHQSEIDHALETDNLQTKQVEGRRFCVLGDDAATYLELRLK